MSLTDNLQRLKTIVIVMMENRSFDHALGFLSHESFDARTDVDGLHQHGDDFDWDNPDDTGKLYAPTATPDTYLPCDLPHSRPQIATQIGGGAMNGFIRSYFQAQSQDLSPTPMRFCRPDDIPVTAALARRYAVCDRWFASVPADTMPNRLMSVSGATLLDNTGGLKPVINPLPDQPTIFDWLDRKQKTFEIYVDAKAISDLVPPWSLLLMSSQLRHAGHLHTLDTLQGRWASNEPAPDVIYCEPFFNDFATALLGLHGNCNHPPLPMAHGEDFLRRVYLALTSNPAKWENTMLVVCYDEHGGFFDHVAPPGMKYNPPAGNKWLLNQPFTTLGLRVPGIIVSPLVTPRSCFTGLLDHTSILQLMVDKLGEPADLSFFGETQARKNNRVQSLAATLTATAPATDVVSLTAAPLARGTATTAAVTELGVLMRAQMSTLRQAQRGPDGARAASGGIGAGVAGMSRLR